MNNEKITGFDTAAIDKPIGRLLGSRDILIFETLFWPLSKRYSYTEEENPGFRKRLAEIRPLLDIPLEFEDRLYQQIEDCSRPIERMGPYIRLHQFLLSLWRTLDREGTYVGIPKVLEPE